MKNSVDLLTPISSRISLNIWDSLKFLNESPCLYAKLRIPVFSHSIIVSFSFPPELIRHNFLRYLMLNSNPTINQRFEKPIINLISPFSLFLLLHSYGRKIPFIWNFLLHMILYKIRLKYKSVLFAVTIALNENLP